MNSEALLSAVETIRNRNGRLFQDRLLPMYAQVARIQPTIGQNGLTGTLGFG